jgi:hypothetical protein
MFEGLGLGARLAFLALPAKYNWVPVVGGLLYGLTTPVGIAVGLGIKSTYNPGSTTASIVSGTLDSISSGILLYTGLVEVRVQCPRESYTSEVDCDGPLSATCTRVPVQPHHAPSLEQAVSVRFYQYVDGGRHYVTSRPLGVIARRDCCTDVYLKET